jgi:hypothetical protein
VLLSLVVVAVVVVVVEKVLDDDVRRLFRTDWSDAAMLRFHDDDDDAAAAATTFCILKSSHVDWRKAEEDVNVAARIQQRSGSSRRWVALLAIVMIHNEWQGKRLRRWSFVVRRHLLLSLSRVVLGLEFYDFKPI